MKLLVTGAAGFLGRYTVAAALTRGHDVKAMVRPHSPAVPGLDLPAESGLDLIVTDLRARASLGCELTDVDAIIHLAGVKVGDLPAQLSGTIGTTEHVIDQLRRSEVRRVIGVSSMAVYDYLALRIGDVLSEESAIESNPAHRSAYVQTKLLQEQMFSTLGAEEGFEVAIMRPGMAYGPHHLWHDLLGIDVGQFHLRIGRERRIPLVHVEHCADALVRAAEVLGADPRPLVAAPVNLVDPNPPTVEEYARAVEVPARIRHVWRVPWWAMRGVVAGVDAVNRGVFDGRAQLPSVASTPELHARFKPLRYSAERARAVLGWSSQRSWREAVEASAATERSSTA